MRYFESELRNVPRVIKSSCVLIWYIERGDPLRLNMNIITSSHKTSRALQIIDHSTLSSYPIIYSRYSRETMSSNRFTGNSFTGSSSYDGQTPRWSRFYEGVEIDLTQPGYEYVAHPVVNEGPTIPVEERERERKEELERKRAARKNKLLSGTRKLVRRLSIKFTGSKPKARSTRGSPLNGAVKPLYGAESAFVPSKDLQLTFTNPSSDMGTSPGQVERFDWSENISYCDTCQLSYLVGKAGLKYADNHPHHLATLNNERSLAVICERSIIRYDAEVYSVNTYWFGPGSEYNLEVEIGPFRTVEDAILLSINDCLDYILTDIIPQRLGTIKMSPSYTENMFLQGDSRPFRLIFFTSFESPPATGNTLTAERRALTEMVAKYADLGIEIRWFDMESVDMIIAC